jgi:uncharacterized protein YegL
MAAALRLTNPKEIIVKIREDIIEREAAANPEPECNAILVLDDSGSMAGRPITALNAALPLLQTEFVGDPLAVKRARITIWTLRHGLVCDCVRPTEFVPPELVAKGGTPLGAVCRKALAHSRARRDVLKKQGMRFYRPPFFIISDGEPDDDYQSIAAELAAADRAEELNVFAIGVEGADLRVLAKFTHDRPPLPLEGLRFVELMRWITQVTRQVTRSASHSGGTGGAPPPRVPLPSVKDWANLKGA